MEPGKKVAFIIIMGVSSSGKTSVGQALAGRLGWDFYDADDFHPPANIAKMAHGIPLNDEDRRPWLAALHDLVAGSLQAGKPGVLACSALKESYRQVLLAGNAGIQIVYLKGDYALILARMAQRKGHYMKPDMLRSQFETLEPPRQALTIEIDQPVEAIVEQIVSALDKAPGNSLPSNPAGH
jgi:carbohydrate kinase (thermoresistant glucokinase family)